MITARERNPERSRERLLEAALEEFADKGYAGARVEAIATRAGLNKQLISHHFGGKEGLYRAVMESRFDRPGGELAGAELELPGGLAALFDRATTDPQWARVLLWEALEGSSGAGDERRKERYRVRRAWIESEQSSGGLPPDLDPDLLLLSLIGAAVYPVLVPRAVELATGLKAEGRTVRRRYREHLTALAGSLRTSRVLGPSK
ncbi:MAG: TetR family transcriptional regulator [Actinomycetia bacterium]|nr:TetR family transcriptional regulator [Actinomycetes bacterium]